MKNITISVPDDVYRQARIKAAERDTSVSALVRDFLISLGNDSDYERRERLQEEILASIETFRGGNRLTRDEIHDRDKVR